MKLKNYLFLSLISFILACGSSKEAQKTATPEVSSVAPERNGEQSGADRRAQFRARREEQRKALVAQLKLSEEQQKKFDEVNAYYAEKMRALRENSAGDRQAMRAGMQEIREEQDLEMEALLDAEQYQTYKKFLEEQRQNRRGRRGQRGGGDRDRGGNN